MARTRFYNHIDRSSNHLSYPNQNGQYTPLTLSFREAPDPFYIRTRIQYLWEPCLSGRFPQNGEASQGCPPWPLDPFLDRHPPVPARTGIPSPVTQKIRTFSE